MDGFIWNYRSVLNTFEVQNVIKSLYFTKA